MEAPIAVTRYNFIERKRSPATNAMGESGYPVLSRPVSSGLGPSGSPGMGLPAWVSRVLPLAPFDPSGLGLPSPPCLSLGWIPRPECLGSPRSRSPPWAPRDLLWAPRDFTWARRDLPDLGIFPGLAGTPGPFPGLPGTSPELPLGSP